jgi:hypothetical protein
VATEIIRESKTLHNVLVTKFRPHKIFLPDPLIINVGDLLYKYKRSQKGTLRSSPRSIHMPSLANTLATFTATFCWLKRPVHTSENPPDATRYLLMPEI